MKCFYTKAQCDLIWSQFAVMVANQQKMADMQEKWDEMSKRSALKDKIIAELKAERKVMDNSIHIREVSI